MANISINEEAVKAEIENLRKRIDIWMENDPNSRTIDLLYERIRGMEDVIYIAKYRGK